jgi:predicted RNA-binding Zn-ribbon protein involved in translation (DUF1610 family)
MEIAPGMSAKFRGSQETWEAVNPCTYCGQRLHYIDDGDYFLCPDCDVVREPSGRRLI